MPNYFFSQILFYQQDSYFRFCFFIQFFGLSNKLDKKGQISQTHKKQKQLQLICTFGILMYRN